MTPKEKVMTEPELTALHLLHKHSRININWDNVDDDRWARDAALVTVNEILKVISTVPQMVQYWKKVKKQLKSYEF